MSHDGSDTPGNGALRSHAGGGRWRNFAITVLLLAVAVVAGMAAYDARSQFWQMYLAFKTGK